MERTVSHRVLILGLDAATFDLIEPWVAQGWLPHFHRLMKEGAWGRLESTIPPVTAVAWNALATGKNPGKFGVFDFVHREADGYSVRMVNGGNRKAIPFWRILDQHGLHAGVINLPMTYPPDRLTRGFIVSGFDAPGFESDFVHPQELKEKLRQLGYLVHYSQSNRRAWASKLIETFELNRRVFWDIYHSQRWDVLLMVFMQMDVAQHLFWRDMEMHTPLFGDLVPHLYQQADALLGEIVSTLDANDILIVVSDHGAGPLAKPVSINQWLLRQGFLTLRKQSFPKRTFNQSLLRFFTLLNTHLPKRVKTVLKKRLSWVRDEVESYLLSTRVDWSRTQAFALGEYGGIFINLRGRESQGIVAPTDYERLRNEIAARLTTLRDPDNGEAVIPRVYRREEVYNGPYVEESPDLVLDWNYAYDCRERVGSEQHDVFGSQVTYKAFSDDKKTGVHRRHGVLLMYGSPIQPGSVKGARVVDITPTLLHLSGIPVPMDMDGRVLTEVLRPEWLMQHPVCYEKTESEVYQQGESGYSAAEEALVKERLRSLGYLD